LEIVSEMPVSETLNFRVAENRKERIQGCVVASASRGRKSRVAAEKEFPGLRDRERAQGKKGGILIELIPERGPGEPFKYTTVIRNEKVMGLPGKVAIGQAPSRVVFFKLEAKGNTRELRTGLNSRKWGPVRKYGPVVKLKEVSIVFLREGGGIILLPNVG
jgi:hypothetical protein